MRAPAIALAISVGMSGAAMGQVRPLPDRRPPVQAPTRDSLARADSIARRLAAPRGDSAVKRDTTRIDTTTVRWQEPDSVMKALMARTGYDVTRFQATSAAYNANTKDLKLDASAGRQAAVDRNGQVMVSDSTIFFNQITGETINLGCYVLNFPGSTDAPIRGCGQVSYNAPRRSAQFTNASVPFNNGENWYLHVTSGAAQIDSLSSGSATIYIRGGRITSCPDSIPDYYFAGKTMKRTASGTVIARDVILYIGDIPTLWLPFIFQNIKKGRSSGLLTTRFGLSDIVRNSPSYHRNIENFGYYWAINDYMDAAAWIDWRSGAGGSGGGGAFGQFSSDPGYIKYNFDWQYNWLDRFLSGNVGSSYTAQGDGSSNLGIRWSHGQRFANNGQLQLSMNYVTNTSIQRRNAFDYAQQLATISSQAQASRQFGPFTVSLGGTRTQYPGRPRLDQTFPTLSISTAPINAGKHVTWTPSFSYSSSSSRHIDQPGTFTYRYTTNAQGGRDSTLIDKSSFITAISFNSPLKVFGQDLSNSFRLNSQRNRYPEQFTIYDVKTGDSVGTRVYAEAFQTDIDWTPTFQLPPFTRNRWNLAPTISLSNVDPGPFWVASERTNGRFVSQSKRLSYGLSATPTIYGLFGGFGPFEALRHTLTPSFGYTYAPAARVSDEYLLATRRSNKGYLGGLRQNAVNFGMSTSLEAKVASDSGREGNKLKVLSVTMSSFSYNFERLRAPEVTSTKWWRGLTTERFSYSIRSDLLPGIDFSSDYSLFQGSTTSDTAVFDPYRESMSATLTLSRNSNPLALLTKLFGKAVPAAQHAGVAPVDPHVTPAQEAQARELAAQPVAGGRQAGERVIVPPSEGWRLGLTLSSSRIRPSKGGNAITYDPALKCSGVAQLGNPFLLAACIENERLSPQEPPTGVGFVGGPVYNVPASTNVGADLGFNLTPRWTVAWRTNYDFVRHEFASHVVNLQRDLHDWRATFGFTQSPNGNFAFNFSIGLKAQPDLKFDYARNSMRSLSGY